MVSQRILNMPMKIRLALHGCTNRPFYKIVVMPRYMDRQDAPVAQIGSYDPIPNKHNERLLAVDFSQLRKWMAKDAEPSKPVAKLLGLAGFLPIHPMTYIEADRKRAKDAETAAASSVEELEAEEDEEDMSDSDQMSTPSQSEASDGDTSSSSSDSSGSESDSDSATEGVADSGTVTDDKQSDPSGDKER